MKRNLLVIVCSLVTVCMAEEYVPPNDLPVSFTLSGLDAPDVGGIDMGAAVNGEYFWQSGNPGMWRRSLGEGSWGVTTLQTDGAGGWLLFWTDDPQYLFSVSGDLQTFTANEYWSGLGGTLVNSYVPTGPEPEEEEGLASAGFMAVLRDNVVHAAAVLGGWALVGLVLLLGVAAGKRFWGKVAK